MPRKKHNISYIKPEEPAFLRELKAQAGYKEGPTVDTKRGDSSAFDGWDEEDDSMINKAEEEPVVVVLNTGDLTAEEAETFKKKKEQEEENIPADLNKRIIFNRKTKAPDDAQRNLKDQTSSKKIKKSKPSKTILSFDEEENEENDE